MVCTHTHTHTHTQTHTAKHTTSITYTCAHQRFARTAFRAIRSSILNTQTTLYIYYYTSTTIILTIYLLPTPTTILLTIYILLYSFFIYTHPYVYSIARNRNSLLKSVLSIPNPHPPSQRPPLLFLTPSFLRQRGGRSHPKRSHFFFICFSFTDH